jgi:hypothetical protein
VGQSKQVTGIFELPVEVYLTIFLCGLLQAKAKPLDMFLNNCLSRVNSHVSEDLVRLALQVSVDYIRHIQKLFHGHSLALFLEKLGCDNCIEADGCCLLLFGQQGLREPERSFVDISVGKVRITMLGKVLTNVNVL